eukprot:scaffold14_cov279-Pinguiococcus_pyrenoidosus.AAC.1
MSRKRRDVGIKREQTLRIAYYWSVFFVIRLFFFEVINHDVDLLAHMLKCFSHIHIAHRFRQTV